MPCSWCYFSDNEWGPHYLWYYESEIGWSHGNQCGVHLIGCGAVWYHRGPNGPIRALIGNQYPPRTFKSTKNILSDPFDPFCYPKPAQTVKIDVLLKYCLKSEKAVRIQIHLTDVLGRINCLSASQRLFRASDVLLDIFEALTESKRSTYSLKLVKRSGG